MRRIGVLLVIIVGMAAGGCIIPIPHPKKTCGTITGSVADAETAEPIAGARIDVYYPDGGHRQTGTDPDGAFRFRSKWRWHWGYYVGGALNFSLPYDYGWWDFSFLTIRAEGYEPSAIAGHTVGSRSGLTGQPLERLTGYTPLDPAGIPDGGDWAYPFIFVSRSSSEPSAEEAGR